MYLGALTQGTETSPKIVRCRFEENLAQYGGGVFVDRKMGTALPHFINCEFYSNSAAIDGGGVNNSRGDLTFVNCVFAENHADDRGGAMVIGAVGVIGTDYAATLYICTLTDNSADDIAGGILVQSSGDITIVNSILWGNADINGSVQSSQLRTDTGSATFNVDYSCVQGLTSSWGIGNISSDPNLTATYELGAGSPAINSADPDVANDDDNGYFPLDEFDLDGDGVTHTTSPYQITPDLLLGLRVQKARLDMGAIEFLSCLGDCVTHGTFQPPPDGIVDGDDLAVLLGDWGPCANCCTDSVTSATFLPPPDGEVDGADLAVLLGAWGDPCVVQGSAGFMEGGGDPNPLENETLGPLLEELIETGDEELAEYVAALLQELMGW